MRQYILFRTGTVVSVGCSSPFFSVRKERLRAGPLVEAIRAEHHTVIVVGGGPAGLPLAVVLAGGWWPYYRPTPAFQQRRPGLARWLQGRPETLLALDFRALPAAGIAPVTLFNALHRPSERFLGTGAIALEFRPGTPLDCLLLSREPVGGVWNKVPKNLLTLSPGHWMEMAFYPLAKWAAETGRSLDPEALIVKHDLIDYYHSIPPRFGIREAIRDDVTVERISPDPEGFRLATQSSSAGSREYTCRYLVYAAGQRCRLRRLGIPGDDLPLVENHYDRPETFPGDRILVVGGGRSADWAATELHDDGREVTYVMRQHQDNHSRLVSDSRGGLAYYARIAEILESGSPRFRTRYETRVEAIREKGREQGKAVEVVLRGPDDRETQTFDRVLLEIGGEVDYDLFQGFPRLTLVEKRDRYRFQCMQMVTYPHNYESVDIPRMYPGGYLAAGLNNVVVAMHGTTYAIAGDILQREQVFR